MFQHNIAYIVIKYYCYDKYFTRNNQNSAQGNVKGNKYVLIPE